VYDQQAARVLQDLADGVPTVWAAEAATLAADLAPLFERLALGGAVEGLAQLDGPVAWGEVNQAALELATERAAAFAGESAATSEARIARVVADWIRSGGTRQDLESAARAAWDTRRAETEAVTEVTRLYAQANRAAWARSGLVRRYRFVTVQDRRVCPTCQPLDKREADIQDTSLLPPKHDRCRCYVVPVV